MTTEWKEGQSVYLPDGRKARFFSIAQNGFIVQPYFLAPDPDSGYDDEEYYDGFEYVLKIFKAPPIKRLHHEVKELSDELAARRAELHETRDTLYRAVQANEEYEAGLKRRIERYAALEHLDNFICGAFTHFVVERSGVITIETKEKALKDRDYPRSTKLMTLFGNSNGDLQWKLNRYKDGSGSSESVWPCISEESARKKAIDLIDTGFEENLENKNFYRLGNFIKAAKALNHPIPDDVSKAFREDKVRRLEKASGDAKGKLQEANTALGKARREKI